MLQQEARGSPVADSSSFRMSGRVEDEFPHRALSGSRWSVGVIGLFEQIIAVGPGHDLPVFIREPVDRDVHEPLARLIQPGLEGVGVALRRMLPAAEIAELLEQNICIMCRALRLLIGASVEADKCVQRKQALFKRILQIRRGVGDIVRRLEQVGQRMAGDPASCFALNRCRADRPCDLRERFLFCGKDSRACAAWSSGLSLSNGARIRRILHQRADDRRRDVDASAAAGLQQDPQRLCVALKILQICDHLRGQPAPAAACPYKGYLVQDSPGTSRRSPSRRSARTADCPDRAADPRKAAQRRSPPHPPARNLSWLVLRRVLRDHDAELSGDRGDLDGVRQPCPDKIAFIQREDLRFILQSAECSAGNDLADSLFQTH